MRGGDVRLGPLLLGDGGRGGTVPLGRKVLGLCWLRGLPGRRKWPPDGTGDVPGQEHNQLPMSGCMTSMMEIKQGGQVCQKKYIKNIIDFLWKPTERLLLSTT